MRSRPAWATVALVSASLLAVGCGSTVRPQPGSGGPAVAAPGQQSGVTASAGTGLGASGGRSGAGNGSADGHLPGTGGNAAGRAGSATAVNDGSAANSAPSSSEIPATGPGWDRSYVYVGVVTNQDIQQVATTLGVDNLDSGDQKADAESMIADLNARGGMFGRQVKGIFYDVKSTTNADTNGQATCTYFTQDHHVVALLNRVLQDDTPSFRACMAKAHTMVLAGGTQALDDRSLNREGGWYVHLTVPSWDRYAPALVRRLQAQGFFDGWDTTTGTASRQPTKVGIIAPDQADSRSAVAQLSRALRKAGRPAADEVFYADQQSLQAAVLRFRSDGITHVFDTDTFLFLFMQNAESQKYRPRYAINTLNGPDLLLQGVVPDAQLGGALGLGWAPNFDVDDQHDANDNMIPGVRTCRSVMNKRGPRYPPNKRYALAYFDYFCDATRLLAAAALRGGGLAPEQIRAGVRMVGPGLQPAFTFTNVLGPQIPTVPGSATDLRWNTSCACFTYGAGPLPL